MWRKSSIENGRPNLVLVGFYLCLLTLPKLATSAPSTHRRLLGIMDGEPQEKWKTPCGQPAGLGPYDGGAATDERNAQLVKQIVNQANIAYSKANDFKEKFSQIYEYYLSEPRDDDEQAQDKYKTDASSMQRHFNGFQFAWLPTVPKNVGQDLQLNETLYETYESLQKIAVGFDRMIADARRRGDRLLGDYEEQEKYVLSVLCEIGTAMAERRMPKRADVEADAMPADAEDADSYFNLRDFIILREYLALLDYVKDAYATF